MRKIIFVTGLLCLILTIGLVITWDDYVVFFIAIFFSQVFIYFISKLIQLIKDGFRFEKYRKTIEIYTLFNNAIWLLLCVIAFLNGLQYNGQIYIYGACFCYYSLFYFIRLRSNE